MVVYDRHRGICLERERWKRGRLVAIEDFVRRELSIILKIESSNKIPIYFSLSLEIYKIEILIIPNFLYSFSTAINYSRVRQILRCPTFCNFNFFFYKKLCVKSIFSLKIDENYVCV